MKGNNLLHCDACEEADVPVQGQGDIIVRNIYDNWAHSKASISFTLEALLLKIYTKKVIANAQRYTYHDIYYSSISNSKR